MVPAAGQGIIGITIRAEDDALHDLLAAIEDAEARIVADAERALLADSTARAARRSAPMRACCPTATCS